MAFDGDTYLRLIRTVTCEFPFYRGTIQDQRGRPTTFSGAPTWGAIPGGAMLCQRANGDGCTTGGTPAVVDVTGDFWCESVFEPHIVGGTETWLLRQSITVNGDAGGFRWYWDQAAGAVQLTLYQAGAGVARTISSAAATIALNYPYHALVCSLAGGTDGRIWLNGVPFAVALGGAGAAGNVASAAVVVGSDDAVDFMLSRCGQGVIGNDEANVLWLASRDRMRLWGIP